MRYRDKPEMQDRLAAEYVLGTLRDDRVADVDPGAQDAARRRFNAEGLCYVLHA